MLLCAANPAAADLYWSPDAPRPGYARDRWTVRDGLPVNPVNDALKTRQGYLWLATSGGLVRFDGARFTVFNTESPLDLPSDRFQTLFETRDSSLWATTDAAGVLRYRDGKFERMGLGDRLGDARPLAFFEDREGTLWLGTTRGVSRLRDGRLEAFEPGQFTGPVQRIYRDRSGTLWISTPNRVVRWLAGTRTRLGPDSNGHGLPAEDFFEDAGGTVWVATPRGLCRFVEGELVPVDEPGLPSGPAVRLAADPDSDRPVVLGRHYLSRFRAGHWTTARLPAAARDAPCCLATRDGHAWASIGPWLYRDEIPIVRLDDDIHSFLIGREGSIWIASTDGLQRLRPAPLSTVVAGDADEPTMVRSILEDRRGTLWLATDRGVGTLSRGTLRPVPLPAGHETVYSLALDRRGGILAGTSSGMLELRDGRFVPFATDHLPAHGAVQLIHLDRSGALWIGAGAGLLRNAGGRWTRFSARDGLPADTLVAACEGRDGSLWFGTRKSGIAIFRQGRFTVLGTRDGLPSGRVRALHQDGRGFFWVGSDGGGMARVELRWEFGRPRATIASLGRDAGLPDDGIEQILEDGDGRLWVGTHRGLFRVALDQLDAVAERRSRRIDPIEYTERHGMEDRQVTGGVHPAAIRSRDGSLWFPTRNGAVVIAADPGNVNRVPPPVVIERLTVEGIAVSRQHGAYVLGAGQRDFEIAYTGLSFLSPGDVRFRYRLEGLQRKWVDAGNRRTAFFTRVPPGGYTFRVTACNNDGVWNQAGAAIPITIAPFFFETAWFRGGVVLLLLVLGFAADRFRVRVLRRRAIELARLVDARTDDLFRQKTESERARTEAELARGEAERNREIIERSLRTIEAQALALRELDHAKSRFFAHISHEFRTPLTLSIGPLQDLIDGLHGPLDRESRAQIEMALRNSRRLLRLVGEILDIARIEAGQMRLERSSGDLTAWVRDLGCAFVGLAERCGVAFRVEVPALPVVACFDPTRLESIAGNLLSNAFKFTPPGGEVSLRLATEGEGESTQALIQVSDTGVGIPGEHLPNLFDRLYQSSVAANLSQAGSGIGLTLVKQLVELHGGSIHADSAPGVGTTFTVRLPLQSVPADPSATRAAVREDAIAFGSAAAAARSAARSSGLADRLGEDWDRAAAPELPAPEGGDEDTTTVLVVEDNPEVRAHLRKHLAREYRVHEAADGDAGLEAVRRLVPDLVVSDVRMPGLNGFDLCRALKQHAATDFIPIVLLTARQSRESRLEGLGCGADDYLAKPFEASELLARIRNLIASRKKLRQRFGAAAPTAPSPDLHADRVPVRSAGDRLLERVRREIQDHLGDERFSVEELARAVGIDRTHLFRKLRALIGEPPAELILRMRLERAAQLLEARAGGVGEIAYAVGFKSVSHFTRRFRDKFGAPPSVFAARHAADPPRTPSA